MVAKNAAVKHERLIGAAEVSALFRNRDADGLYAVFNLPLSAAGTQFTIQLYFAESGELESPKQSQYDIKVTVIEPRANNLDQTTGKANGG